MRLDASRLSLPKSVISSLIDVSRLGCLKVGGRGLDPCKRVLVWSNLQPNHSLQAYHAVECKPDDVAPHLA